MRSRWRWAALVGLCWLGLPTQGSGQMLVTAVNPDPSRLPTLGVWQKGRQIFVSAEFPQPAGQTVDAWCYEHNDITFLGARALDGGRIELQHRFMPQPDVILVTTVTPEPDAVEYRVQMERAPGGGAVPVNLTRPNMCWQLQRAPLFASKPDPYPEFVRRCFLFTERGRTFLHETTRLKIPPRPADDPRNNPPWVQNYLLAGVPKPRVTERSWADYSPDRYTAPIIGTVSRDGRYLAAIANDGTPSFCQAWHDCLHNNAEWRAVPGAAGTGGRLWRVKAYLLPNDPAALLARVARDFPKPASGDATQEGATGPTYQKVGVEAGLPVFLDRLKARQEYPMAWAAGRYAGFPEWRTLARRRVMDALVTPPPRAPFNPLTIAEQDRGTHVARKVVFNVSGDSRILALMTVPKGTGPFPAVLLLHDHSAKFDIGKEKVIEPWDDDPARIQSAREFVVKAYGGRFIGDELARRGYVCFAIDALNWSDRGGAGYEGQQALASNLLHYGMSWAGLIAHEDLRSAEFLATCPEVDNQRIAAMGLSVGAWRTWQVAALSDHIAAGAAICWMATLNGVMNPGANRTRGQSAFSMTHPGLFRDLDFPDIAGIACPKPMLFYNGLQDKLFPIPSVEEAYARMRVLWTSQGAADRLETRLWDVPHEFNRDMQEAAIAWLDRWMGK